MGGGIRTDNRATYSNHVGNSYNATLDQYVDQEKPKVFISFSMRDKYAVELLRNQALNDKYDIEFVDNSLQHPVKNGNWKYHVEGRIARSDVMIVMVGDDTHERSAVNWELNRAYENNIPVVPVRIHKNKRNKLPYPIKRRNDGTVEWKLEYIREEIDYATGS